ncbi:TetR family transcriptional regulator [Streptomyces antimycoticus]|uniref:TetR/AcrR family transcriptional regulator n=3 Tax=Streptomyces TaxID=1883 RepID=A0ABD5JFZ9_9ACTN|nr:MULTISPECIES: TetR/AcrR family transcriptional regulator [Streptomyces]MEE4586512.1 TetR/AcrR family transcriptional regulator [Streptomyces sp. DSM 41602]KUL48228.1 TetR family transcriptional regulator [Streptomyces violaceusniger]RSS40522.1 TetR/AcrR family transcriptional regulator [Streptomyces sp. WAC05858]WJE02379.1 TetR/AcrR family transcriptional regulator [Streptomyces antimycoticus]WTA87017.1 TetR family transcriptional regulator [Streptomyces antimycoticus]
MPPLRRQPVQRRSAERLGRILDACAELLDEISYEELSTRAVAERANVPIGSVYRFFSNKRAMAEALAHRNLDEYAARITRRLAASESGPDHGPDSGPNGGGGWREAMDVVVDEYLAMKRGAPGFALIEFGNPVPATAQPQQPNHLVADRLRMLLADRLATGAPAGAGDAAGDEAAEERLRVAFLLAVEAADALLRLAFRVDPEGDPAIVAETKELLRAYLARVLD